MNDGFYNGVIMGIRPVKMRFAKEGDGVKGFELEFTVGIFDEKNQPLAKVEIYEEFSTRYGLGNNAQKTRAQMCVDTLRKLGYAQGEDLSQLSTLVNKQCRINVSSKDKDGKPRKNGTAYFFSFNEVQPLEGDLNALVKEIMAGVGGAPVSTAGAGAPPPPPPSNGGFSFPSFPA